MKSNSAKLGLSLGLVVTLGLGLLPFGCGASPRAGSVGALRGDMDVPDGIARQIRTCAAEHAVHLSSGDQAVRFEVKLTADGEVDSVSLRDSTLGDEPLEACIAVALRSLSEEDLSLRRSEVHPRSRASPESRMLLGQEEALGCLANPPCLLTLGFLIGAAFIVVEIYLHASQSSISKAKPHAAPPAAPPTEEVDCKKVKETCIDKCSDTALPTPDFGAKYFKCFRACMEAAGC